MPKENDSPLLPAEASPPLGSFTTEADGRPVWNAPENNPYKRFKAAQRKYRAAENAKRYDELEAGPKKFLVGVVGQRDKHELFSIDRHGRTVKKLVVGASSAGEARDKFCRISGIHAGLEMVKAEPAPA